MFHKHKRQEDAKPRTNNELRKVITPLTEHMSGRKQIRQNEEQSNSQRRQIENTVFRMNKTLRVMLKRLSIDELRKNGIEAS